MSVWNFEAEKRSGGPTVPYEFLLVYLVLVLALVAIADLAGLDSQGAANADTIGSALVTWGGFGA